MRTTNKQATKAKNSNLSRRFHTATICILAAVALPLLIADADNTAVLILTKVAGVALLTLAGYIHTKTDNPNAYADEYIR